METIKLTETAQLQAKNLLDKQEDPSKGFRIAVVGRGCRGLQYKIGWSTPKEGDLVHSYDNGLKVLVDQKSASLLDGATMEFHIDPMNPGFEVVNPNSEDCGGCSKRSS